MSPGRRTSSSPREAARYTFFGGKGGVGKTTCAAAFAIARAESPEAPRVLVASTDPAHSLGDALDGKLGAAARSVAGVRGHLDAVELDADRALGRWLRDRRAAFRLVAQHGTYLDDEDIDRFLDLSLPGVDELVGLVELARVARAGRYDEVVVDTAPTGHTLRLLGMPATLRRIAAVLDGMQGKHRFLAESLGGRLRADAGDLLVEDLEREGLALEALLADPARAGFRWVLLPEALPLAEAEDGVRALAADDIAVDELVVNRVRPAPTEPCDACRARHAAEREILDEARRRFPDRALRIVPALDEEPRGVVALRPLGKALARRELAPPATASAGRRAAAKRATPTKPKPPAWLDAIAPPGVRLVVLAGKGGVGKTTVAAACAIGLAAREPWRRVLALSTDPAHSLGDALAVELGDEERAIPGAPSNLRARELDAAGAFAARRERYQDAVDELFDAIGRGSRFDPTFDRAVLRDLIDLAPPGLDELFAILSLGDALVPPAVDGNARAAGYDLVVVDTAPTGHALRLLAMPAAAQEWVRALLAVLLKYRDVVGLGDLAAELVELARQLRQLRQLLAAPSETRAVAVTRAAELPVRETLRLVAGLDRLAVPLAGVVVNALTEPACRRCRRERARQDQALAPLARACTRRPGCVMLHAPARFPPPRGVATLASWSTRWARHDEPATQPTTTPRRRAAR